MIDQTSDVQTGALIAARLERFFWQRRRAEAEHLELE